MSNSNEKGEMTNEMRRQFLKSLSVIAITGGSGFAVTTSAQAGVNVRKSEGTKISGYRETQHIRDYYDSL